MTRIKSLVILARPNLVDSNLGPIRYDGLVSMKALILNYRTSIASFASIKNMIESEKPYCAF